MTMAERVAAALGKEVETVADTGPYALDSIVLGDAYELIKQVPDKSVDLVYTDIPYEGGYNKGHNHMERTGMSGEDGLRREAALSPFINGCDLSIFAEAVRVCRKPNIWAWLSFSQVKKVMDLLGPRFEYQLLVWCKTNSMVMNYGQLVQDLEYLLRISGGQSLPNPEKLRPSKFYISPTNAVDSGLYGHPTIKPLELVSKHIRIATDAGGVVLDPFIGSGTTAAACRETGRRYLGFEINPEYWRTAVDRVNGITKKERESGYVQTSIFGGDE